MAEQPVTLRDSISGKGSVEGSGLPTPGLLLIFAMGEPRCTPIPIASGVIDLGRGDGKTIFPADPRMSRKHASISFDGERFRVIDAAGPEADTELQVRAALSAVLRGAS